MYRQIGKLLLRYKWLQRCDAHDEKNSKSATTINLNHILVSLSSVVMGKDVRLNINFIDGLATAESLLTTETLIYPFRHPQKERL